MEDRSRDDGVFGDKADSEMKELGKSVDACLLQLPHPGLLEPRAAGVKRPALRSYCGINSPGRWALRFSEAAPGASAGTWTCRAEDSSQHQEQAGWQDGKEG